MNLPAFLQWPVAVAALALVVSPDLAIASAYGSTVVGIPLDFILFALTLLGVALFHHLAPPASEQPVPAVR